MIYRSQLSSLFAKPDAKFELLEVFEPEVVLGQHPFLWTNKGRCLPSTDGEIVPVPKGFSHLRLEILRKTPICSRCGRKGMAFARLRSHCKGQIRLVFLCEDGVILTVDHIVPRALGGKTDQFNLQTLCETCNILKAAHEPTEFYTCDIESGYVWAKPWAMEAIKLAAA